MLVHTTTDRVIEAANKCESTKKILKTLFPNVFEGDWVNVTKECTANINTSDNGAWITVYHEKQWIMETGLNSLPYVYGLGTARVEGTHILTNPCTKDKYKVVTKNTSYNDFKYFEVFKLINE